MEENYIHQRFNSDWRAAQRAESAIAATQPGKKFLPRRPRQVSINHSCLAWLSTAPHPMAQSRARGVLFCV
jgi:hypothetical protein